MFGAPPHLLCAVAVIEQLNSAQLENLVQEGRRLVDVDRNGALAGWIPHSFIKVFQPGGRAVTYTDHIGGEMQYARVHTEENEDVGTDGKIKKSANPRFLRK